MQLVRPTIKYKTSFQNALREFAKEGSNEGDPNNVQGYIRERRQYVKGINLPKGYVPASTYWLIDKGQFIGRVGVRHKLNKRLRDFGGHIGYAIRPSKRKKGYGTQILKLALLKAKKLGLKQVMITCDEFNIASRKIIESNGGKLKEKVKSKESKNGILRKYWIKL